LASLRRSCGPATTGTAAEHLVECLDDFLGTGSLKGDELRDDLARFMIHD
jgi:hypothetical protein